MQVTQIYIHFDRAYDKDIEKLGIQAVVNREILPTI